MPELRSTIAEGQCFHAPRTPNAMLTLGNFVVMAIVVPMKSGKRAANAVSRMINVSHGAMVA